MSQALLALNITLMVAGGVGVLVLVVIVVAVLLRGKAAPSAPATPVTPSSEPEIKSSPNNLPSMVVPVRHTERLNKDQPPSLPPTPSAGPGSGDGQLVSTSGRVIQVPTELSAGEPSQKDLAPLEPSLTGESPMLAEASLEPSLDEPMKMGTDELPRMGTAEMPRMGTGEMPSLDDDSGAVAEKPRYRTPQAQALQEAIETMKCPKCGQPTFVGRETPEEIGADGTGMFKLEGRCGACGHKSQIIDMRMG